MVTFAQAQERAERWVNGEVPAPQHREVRVREFDLGFVAWAEDRENGPRSDGGRSRLVIARDSGETTLWPGLPVGEVIRRYEEEYGAVAEAGHGAPEPAQRIDLEATSFLLTPPEWLQEAADSIGVPDRRAAKAPAPAAGAPASASDAWAEVNVNGADDAGADPSGVAAPEEVPPVPFGDSAGGGDPDAVTAAGAAGVPGGTAGGSDETPWAGTDTTGDGPEDRSVGLPATVFAPPLAEFDEVEDVPSAPPRVRPEAKTELLRGGSQLPRTQVAPALDLPDPDASDGTGPPPAGGPGGLPVPPPAPPAPPAGAAAGLPDLPPPSGPPATDVPPPAGAVPGAPGPGGGGVHAAATMLADGSALPGNAGGPPPPPGPPPAGGPRPPGRPGAGTPPPPGAPGTPGAGRAGQQQDAARIADAATSRAQVQPPGGPSASGPGAPGAPAGGYVPTQLVSQLDAAELDLSAVDGPSGDAQASGGAEGPGGTGSPHAPGAPGGGVHAAATMMADGAALQASLGQGGPGAATGPGVPPPPAPPGVPGAPKPPGVPGAGGAAAAHRGSGGQSGPPPPPSAPPAAAGGGVHAAATMLADGASLQAHMPGPSGPGPAAPPAAGPPVPPPGVPTGPPGAPGPGGPGAYGYPQAPGGQPTVGPGYMAVLSYRAPDGSEQKIVRRSAPGTPHPEWQLLHELRGMNIPPQQVLELHTELESCDLPGGYCARMVRENWPQVRISHTAAYGRDHASRQQGVRHLVEHQGELHQVADGPARPAPVRVPLPHPSQVQPVPPVPPQVFGQELEQSFGQQGIFRFDQRAVSRHGVPDVVAQTLVWAGLPVDFGPFFWAQAQPGRPVPTLAELAAERGVQPAADAGSYLVMGNDFGRQLCVQYGTANIVAIPMEGGPGGQPATPQFVNSGLPEFVRCLAMLGRMWRLRFGLTPEQAGRWTVDFQAQLVALDPPALGSPETWWSVLLEQMWDGLL
ncbi:SUKH-4 family immunity protein [Streptomyces sp. NPDC091266]|uniref:SUKH-4 family immunity protein n=1 Tax=Streptomyces sp. NPDC091266 TaxID=3365978 RepID=UPI0037F1F8D9